MLKFIISVVLIGIIGYLLLISSTPEQPSPQDWIKEDAILVYEDKVVINIENAQWAKYVNSNSMDPTLDDGMNGIEIVPEKPEDIKVGDIIAYEEGEDFIVHRVGRIGYDDEGVYFITRGDNNPSNDWKKVRFKQIRGVLVAVIY